MNGEGWGWDLGKQKKWWEKRQIEYLENDKHFEMKVKLVLSDASVLQ